MTLNNFRIRTKIIAGYLFTLILMIIVGAVAIVRLNQINTTVTDLADNLAQDQHLSDHIVSQIWISRFYALRYINQHNPEDLAQFNQEQAGFNQILTEAEQQISRERAVMLTGIKTNVTDYQNIFAEIVSLMDERDKIVTGELDVLGPQAVAALDQLQLDLIKTENTSASPLAIKAHQSFLLMRLDAFKYLQAGDEAWIEKFEKRYQEVQTAFEGLNARLQTTTQRQLFEEATTAAGSYHQSFMALTADYTRQNDLLNTRLNVIGPQVAQAGTLMADSVAQDFRAAGKDSLVLVLQTRTILLVIIAGRGMVGAGYFA